MNLPTPSLGLIVVGILLVLVLLWIVIQRWGNKPDDRALEDDGTWIAEGDVNDGDNNPNQ